MKIVILDAYAANPGDLSWDEFAALGDLTVYDRTAQEDAAARIGDAEVVFINKVRLTDEIFAACPNLKLVSILATGYNIVDLAAAKRRGITVCNVPGYSTRAVVQMTFALLLEICQQVGLHSGAVHTGRWQTCPDFCFWDRPLIELDGKTFQIVDFQHVKPGKGPAFVRTKLKNLENGRVLDNTFSAGVKIEPVRVERRPYQFTYEDDLGMHFMHTETFEEINIDKNLITNYDLMADGQIVEVMFHTEKETVLSAELPPIVDMEVTYTEPGIKGDTASTNSLKPATVNTGATVRVPLFINTGDKIRVDTRTREYYERIK